MHVLWLTSGLGCDGDSVAITAATSPSLEELLRGVLPGMPRLALYNPLLAYETGEDFLRAFRRRGRAAARSVRARARGLGAQRGDQRRGPLGGFGVDPEHAASRSPTSTWIDRLAPRAAAVLALGTCAAYGGIPAMRGNPTGAMGLRDYLGARLDVTPRPADRQPARLSGAARQHHRDAAAPGAAPGRRRRRRSSSTSRAGRAGCSSAPCRRAAAAPGFAEHGDLPTRRPTPAAAWSSSAARARWSSATSRCAAGSRRRRLPERGRDLHRLHDARLPRPLHAVHGAQPARRAARARATVHLRAGAAAAAPAGDARDFDVEPEWRRPRDGAAPAGYQAPRGGDDASMPTRLIFRCEFCDARPIR